MAGIAHFSFGFAGKLLDRRIPLFVFLIASEFLDLLWILFYLTGLEGDSGAPWSHGLFMALFWSALLGAAVLAIFRSRKSALLAGLAVFSHWVLDFITHPMGALFGGQPLPADLFLLFYRSPRVGLGLYNHSRLAAYIAEFGIFGLGLGAYIVCFFRGRNPKPVPAAVSADSGRKL